MSPPIALRIHSLSGVASERSWPTSTVRIGSHPASDLILSGRGVAEHHCTLERTTAGLMLRDDGALATFVNSEQLVQPRLVGPHDRIYVGEVALELVATLAPAPHAPAPPSSRRRALFGVALAAASLATFVLIHAPADPPSQAVTTPSAPSAPSTPSAPSPPEPAQQPTSREHEPVTVHHAVIPGELLADIAARYHVSVHDLARTNNLNPDIPPPQDTVLHFEARDPPLPKLRLRHTVEVGDTWASLSRRFAIDVELLRRYNEGIHGQPVPRSEFIVWVDPHIERRREVREYRRYQVAQDALSIGAPSGGSLEHGLQLPASDLYERILPNLQFGSSHTILHLQRGISMFRQRYNYAGVLVVANLSEPTGGPLKPHVSHQSGRDVDIWLPALKGTYQTRHLKDDRKPKFAEINWYAAWALVESLLATGEVKYVFLDRDLHPQLRAAAVEMGAPPELLNKIQTDPSSSAPVRHAANHTGHIHVRFKCNRDLEPRCSERAEIEDP